jgi:hypothetical protein
MRMHRIMAGVVVVGVVATLQLPALGREDKAAEVMASTRKAIGGKKLEGMTSFSTVARVQRNMGNMQIAAETEFLLEMPDKYLRSDAMSGGPIAVTTTMGFNGETSLGRVNAPGMGSGMVIRMGGPGGAPMGPDEKLTPEQQARVNAAAVRSSRQDVSRLMLGWFGMTHPTLRPEFTYAGEAESPDGKAHVIDVSDADGFAVRLFVDQDTHLPLMLTYKGPQMRMMTTSMRPGGAAAGAAQGRQMSEEEREKMREEIETMRAQAPEMVEYSLFFSDWRDADGIKFPHQVQRAVGGTTDEEWTFSKVRVNPKIDPGKFQPTN